MGSGRGRDDVTPDQFDERETALLQKLPIEFQSVISVEAYDRGHSNGREEVLIILDDMIDKLLPCIEAYTVRIRKEKTP